MFEVRDELCHPIIYVRGYAMTEGEKDETAADPFCGLNLGSTVYRAVADRTKAAQRFYFESTVVRLMTDFGYSHVYDNGLDLLDPLWDGALARRIVVIYRYYDECSPLVGGTQQPSMENFARNLSKLILEVKKKVCRNPDNRLSEEDFRCYLVAHSMGGLICRAFLSNDQLGEAPARSAVDKFFTYATPHNGIEMAGVNVPRWLSMFDVSTFNREELANLFDLKQRFKDTGRVDWVRPTDCLPIDRYFCMIGSNRSDYDVAMGLSRTFSGHGGDGLVKIANATTRGYKLDSDETVPAAEAYAYRSHSGHFGIVNSEESYQNLIRFLFGSIRVDIWLEIEDVTLPQSLSSTTNVEALYQFEVYASPRGEPWYLTRRTAEEDSVACRTHTELTSANTAIRKKIYLSTVFLADWARVQTQSSLAYCLTLGVRVPDYAVGGRRWLAEHYEGTYLFRDTIIIELMRPLNGTGHWIARWGWQSRSPSHGDSEIEVGAIGAEPQILRFELVDSNKTPDINGRLAFHVRAWNVHDQQT